MALTGFNDKVVLITGASGSIGSGTAVEYARLGAKLALTGRDWAKLETTADSCREAGAEDEHIFIITGDITEEDDIKSVVDKTVETFGRIDILVNCAGMIRSGDFLSTNMADYDIIFKTNMMGTFLMCQKAVPHIIKSKGNIINVSSFTGIRPAHTYLAYTMAEAALDQMTRSLALDLGPKGVRVNSVNPGVVRGSGLWTKESAPYADKADTVPQVQEDLKNKYPLRRLAEVRDVTKAIVFLSSDVASFVTGNALPVDGGKILTSVPPIRTPKPQA